MKYLTDLSQEIGNYSTDLRVPYSLIDRNTVAKAFHALGYKYIHVSSTWNGTSNSHLADRTIRYGNDMVRNEFLRELLNTTFLRVMAVFIVNDLAKVHLYNFEKLKEIPSICSTFTFPISFASSPLYF
jgi:hypothetical protein